MDREDATLISGGRLFHNRGPIPKLLGILQTCLLGLIFTAFMIGLSSTTVVFSADQVVVGVAGGFQTFDFSMPFVFAIALIDFLFSFSIQIACFSQSQLPHLHPGLSVIIECKLQPVVSNACMRVRQTEHRGRQLKGYSAQKYPLCWNICCLKLN